MHESELETSPLSESTQWCLRPRSQEASPLITGDASTDRALLALASLVAVIAASANSPNPSSGDTDDAVEKDGSHRV